MCFASNLGQSPEFTLIRIGNQVSVISLIVSCISENQVNEYWVGIQESSYEQLTKLRWSSDGAHITSEDLALSVSTFLKTFCEVYL